MSDANLANGVAKNSTNSYVSILDYGGSIIQPIRDDFMEAMKKAYPDATDVPIVIVESKDPKYGDYQFNSAMTLSKKLGIPPQEIARTLLKHLPPCKLIEKAEMAGTGFINLFLNDQEIGRRLEEIYRNGIDVTLPKLESRKVVVDFSSPNIAKEMHVGHLRSTIIGDSICRLFEKMGFEVLRLNHIGDWGTQFGMLIAHLQDRFPNYVNEAPPIGDLLAFYKESKQRFDSEEGFKKLAYECVVKLQNFNPEIVKAWKLICDVSREDFERIYQRLDITITERGESFYQTRMIQLAKELEADGKLQLDEGRKIMFANGYTVPLIMVKRDGGYTYDTSDMAALKQRLFEENADWIIYVVDAGQSLHLETVFAAGRDLGWYDPKEKKVQHVDFGLVCGDDKKKLKTREGKAIRLTDLLDEGIKRARAKMAAKNANEDMTSEEIENAVESIAYGGIKYADLSQNRKSDYVFSFDKMLEDKGNTAVYLLYAYARIRSISRKADVPRSELLAYFDHLKSANLDFPLDHKSELKLAKHILKFSDCILTVLDSLLMNQLCDYIYVLATLFHDFYNECYVIHVSPDGDKQLFLNRLILCEITSNVMKECLHLLGLKVIEKM